MTRSLPSWPNERQSALGDAEFVIERVAEALAPWTRASEPYAQALSKGRHCRWLLPADGRKARKVLAGWRPYGLASYLKWFAARSLTRLPVAAGRVPGLGKLPPLPVLDGAGLGLPEAGPISLVVYVGTPGHQRKAVCTLVNSDGHASAIIKLPLAKGARASLARETENLVRLQVERPDLPVPRALPLDDGCGVHGQTILRGRPSGREFSASHANFLLGLPGDGSIDLTGFATALHQRAVAAKLPASVLASLERVRGQVPAVWLHGDFAPWNLLINAMGQLVAFDWEDGQSGGLPVWDVAHFHVQQAFLFGGGEPPLARMEANAAYHSYLEGMALTVEQGRVLFGLYCIFNAGKALADGQVALASFLLEQIETETAGL